MNRLCRHWLPLLLGCLIFASCTEDDLVDRVEEGLPVTLKLSFSVRKDKDIPVTRATAEIESNIYELALFFYKDNGTKPIVKHFTNLQNPTIDAKGNYIYEIELDPQNDAEIAGLTSGQYYLYATANWDNAFMNLHDNEALLENGISFEDFKKHVVTRKLGNNNLDLMVRSPMSGKFGKWTGDGSIILEPGENNFTGKGEDYRIHLRRLMAKIQLNISTGSDDIKFTPESYSIYNFSCSSTLFERMGWDNDDTGTKPTGLDYKGEGVFDQFENLRFIDGSNGSILFYMPENVQKITGETYNKFMASENPQAMREKRKNPDDTEENRPFEYAPEHSTYVVIKGYYEGPISEKDPQKVRGDVTYTIQLGDFNPTRGGVDNFTLRRNTAYTYNVKINGVSSITKESWAENFDEEERPGAEGDLIAETEGSVIVPLDAHYEKVQLRIRKSIIENPVFFVNTPFCNTEKVSKYGIDPVQLGSEADVPDDSKDYKWVHFSKPDDAKTFGKYNKGVGLGTVFDLLRELSDIQKNGKTETAHCRVIDGYIYTTAYVDENFYSKNPIDGSGVSLSDFIDKPNRSLLICTTKEISVDGKSTYVTKNIISLSQCAIHTIYPIDGSNISDPTYNPFGIEKINEWPEMQRGTTTVDNDLTLEEGWANTQKLIGTMSGDYTSAVGYMFPDNSSISPTFITGDVKNVPYVAAMSRNRDVDDNGIIDDSELKWYIPARNQCVTLWMGNRDLGEYRPYNADDLSTTKNVEGPEGLIHTSSKGQSRVWWAIEGASFGNQDGSYDMRCIRNLNENHYKSTSSQFSKCTGNIIEIHGLSDKSIRNTNMEGEYAPFHKERELNNRVARKFEVAQNDLTIYEGGSAGDTYTPDVVIANDDCDNSKTQGQTRYYIHTVTVSITRVDGRKYYANSSSSLSGATEITGNTYTGTVDAQGGKGLNLNYKTTSYLYILADNGNYVEIGSEKDGNKNSKAKINGATVLDSNQPVAAKTRSTFTLEEIKALTNLAAANYSQEADKSDLGQWRVPNQRELSLIMSYVSLGTISSSSFSDASYACSTFYTAQQSGKSAPFHINSITGDAYITLGTAASYRIRPVRDVK